MQHSTTHPKITALTHLSAFNKSIFVIALAGLGAITTLAALVGLVSAILLLSDGSLPSLANTMLINGIVDLTIGTLILASWRAFAGGKILAVWLFGGSIVLDTAYSLARHYPLHYVLIGFGSLLIWQLLKYRDEWEIS